MSCSFSSLPNGTTIKPMSPGPFALRYLHRHFKSSVPYMRARLFSSQLSSLAVVSVQNTNIAAPCVLLRLPTQNHEVQYDVRLSAPSLYAVSTLCRLPHFLYKCLLLPFYSSNVGCLSVPKLIDHNAMSFALLCPKACNSRLMFSILLLPETTQTDIHVLFIS